MADTTLELEQVERYVSRSRRRALFDAAQAEAERLRRGLRIFGRKYEDGGKFGGGDLDWDALRTVDWDAEFADDEELLAADPFAVDGYEWGGARRVAQLVAHAAGDGGRDG